MRSKWYKYILSLVIMFSIDNILHRVFAQENAQNKEVPRSELDDLKWQLKQMEEVVKRQQEQIEAIKKRVEAVGTEAKPAENEEATHAMRVQIKNAYEDYPSTEETQKAIELGMPDVTSIYTPTGDIEGRFYSMSVMSLDEMFSLNLGLRLQTRYTFKDNDEDAGFSDKQDINLSQARLYLNGNIYSKWLRYYVELSGDNFKTQLEEWNIYWAPFHDNTVITKFGFFKVPFNTQRLTTVKLLFMDRSIADNAFNQGRDYGMDIYGKPFNGYMEYHATVVQGAGKDPAFWDKGDNLDNKLLYVLNVRYNPLGWYDYYDETDVYYSNKLKATIGASVAFNGKVNGETKLKNTDVTVGVVDLGMKYKGLSWSVEYFVRTENPESDGGTVKATGVSTQAGYFLLPKRLEFAIRYSLVDPNTDESHNLQREYLGGINYYFRGHRSKIQADVGRFITDGEAQEIEENRIRLGYQIIF